MTPPATPCFNAPFRGCSPSILWLATVRASAYQRCQAPPSDGRPLPFPCIVSFLNDARTVQGSRFIVGADTSAAAAKCHRRRRDVSRDLLRLGSDLLHDRPPLRALHGDIVDELLRTHRLCVVSHLPEFRDQLGTLQGPAQVLIDLLHDRRWCTVRSDHDRPAGSSEAIESFCDRRNVGEIRQAGG